MAQTSSVLIVDDDAGVRGALEATLSTGAYRLSFACNGAEAIRKAKDATPDVILLDLMMPGMDGYDVCRNLRQDPLLAQVPIIILTALDDRASLLAALEAGADEFVAKPYDRVELRARVQTAARLNRFQQLLAERAKFEWVVERARDGYLITDPDGLIVYANAQARLYVGLDAKPAPSAGETFLSLVRRHFQCEPARAWSMWASVPASDMEGPLYLVQPETPSLPALWLEVETLDLPGQPAGRLILLRDISDQVHSARQRWAFCAVMTSRWHAPLSNILNSLELLNGQGRDVPAGQIAGGIGTAVRAVRMLDAEITQVLDFVSHADAKPPTVCPASLIADLVHDNCHRLKLKPAVVRVSKQAAQAALPLSPQMLDLIIHALLQNARHLHPAQDPSVTVQVSIENQGQLTVEVITHEAVLSPNELLRFWNPVHVDGRGFGGGELSGGLGLSMVAATVWELGGSVAAANRDGQRELCVEVKLPLARTQ